MPIKRKKLLAYTDLKSEANRRKSNFKRKGYRFLTIKKEYGGYALKGQMPLKKIR